MERIVSIGGERVLLKGTVIEDSWEVFTREANGHREVSFKNRVIWEDTGERAPLPVDQYLAQFDGEDLRTRLAEIEKEKEEKREKQREKNAQRAKTKCRWFIKAAGLNELLTITYRDNQQDRALCKVHFKEWARRMKRALGGKFEYVASFEKQDRGAMHVHVACHKLPSHGTRHGQKIKAWKLGTEIWRSIVGENNGLVFVGGKTKHGGKRRNLSLAKLAAYVSKYIMKDYADAPLESNRYSRSNGLAEPKARQEKGSSVGPRPELQRLLAQLQPGDTLVVYKMDRIARSLKDLLSILDRIKASGAAIRSLTEPLDTSSPLGIFMIQILGAVGQLERSITRERTVAGQVAAIKRGVVFGRPKLLTPEQESEVLAMVDSGVSQSATARHFGVTLIVVRRVLDERAGRKNTGLYPVLKDYL